jgi:hypothetical protein
MDQRMCFTEHIDVMVVKALAMLGFIGRVSGEFREFYVSRAPKT